GFLRAQLWAICSVGAICSFGRFVSSRACEHGQKRRNVSKQLGRPAPHRATLFLARRRFVRLLCWASSVRQRSRRERDILPRLLARSSTYAASATETQQELVVQRHANSRH